MCSPKAHTPTPALGSGDSGIPDLTAYVCEDPAPICSPGGQSGHEWICRWGRGRPKGSCAKRIWRRELGFPSLMLGSEQRGGVSGQWSSLAPGLPMGGILGGQSTGFRKNKEKNYRSPKENIF